MPCSDYRIRARSARYVPRLDYWIHWFADHPRNCCWLATERRKMMYAEANVITWHNGYKKKNVTMYRERNGTFEVAARQIPAASGSQFEIDNVHYTELSHSEAVIKFNELVTAMHSVSLPIS